MTLKQIIQQIRKDRKCKNFDISFVYRGNRSYFDIVLYNINGNDKIYTECYPPYILIEQIKEWGNSYEVRGNEFYLVDSTL